MQTIKLAYIASIVLVCGCFVQTGLAPVDSVISNPSKRDFKFEGTWRPVDNPEPPADVESYLLGITRADDGMYTVTLQNAAAPHLKSNIQFKAQELSEEGPHAIVEILGEDVAFRRLAIASVVGDKLFLWMLDGKKIGERLYNDGTSAVIEHFTFSSTIRCEPEQLLDTIKLHSKDLTGRVQTFHRAD